MTHRWRVSRAGRIGACLPLAVLLTIGGLLALQGDRASDRVGGWAFLLLTPLGYWLFALRPYVEMGPTSMVVRNPFRCREFPLSQIRGIEGGYSGLVIELLDGRTVTAWAVQQSNLAAFMGWRGRAPDLVSVLGELRHQGPQRG